MNKIQINLLILLVIVILLRFLSKIPNTRNNEKPKKNEQNRYECSFSSFLTQKEILSYDFDKNNDALFSLEGSEDVTLARVNGVEISSQSNTTASGFYGKKRLINRLSDGLSGKYVLLKYWVLQKVVFLCEVKNTHLERVKKHFSENSFRLINGLIFGDFSRVYGMNDDLHLTFKAIGMLHVVSASGYNVALVMAMIERGMGFLFPRFIQKVVLFMALWLYAVLAGMNASMVRAAIMATILLLLATRRRQYHPFLALVVSSLCMVLVHPGYLGDLSFQLSVSASIGIILVVPLCSRLMVALNKRFSAVFGVFYESFLTTVAAQIFVLPVLLVYFGELNVVGFISNTFLLWMIPILTILSFGFYFISFLHSFFPLTYFDAFLSLYAQILETFISFFIDLARFIDVMSVGLGSFDIQISGIQAISAWMFALLSIFYLKIKKYKKTTYE